MVLVVIFILLLAGTPSRAERVVVPLNGTWDVAEGRAPDELPASYRHRAPVPGLANLAEPSFPHVDLYDDLENVTNQVRRGILPPDTPLRARSRQDRDYFWYRTRFRPTAQKQVATLKIGKAQFGTAVWLNGKKIGDHAGCFTAGYFNVTPAIRWNAENELVVRIGAHPGVLPGSFPTGTDFEKNKWTPGIYDTVALHLADNPVIETVQVAPRISQSAILIETSLRNYGPATRVTLTNQVKGAGEPAVQTIALAEGEQKTIRQTIALPNPQLWTPETPHLYTLLTTTQGDSVATRFGHREFRFDTATRRAYLNGKPYFMRGSNITLHRFFEDPQCRRLPWDEQWVRKLLTDIPKRMHWNSFRFCIGPVPDQWLEIADEAGLLIQNEFFVWTWREQWDVAEMKRQYREWMRDNWNHASVVIWDAQNETRADIIADVINAVRPLDLSGRPWENGYNLPAGPDDPIEDHPYLFSRVGKGFEPANLENMTGAKSTNSAHPSAHAVILNEYGWLWLNRDGTPTELTKDVYAHLAGPNATADQRFDLYAYYLGGLTEFWRAHRNFAAVLHFTYLTCSYPGGFTSDHWRDVANLELEPHFADYMEQAFRPLGVYLNYWQPKLAAGAQRRFAVMMVNDGTQPAGGKLVLTLEAPGGAELARVEKPFRVPGLGQETYNLDVRVPAAAGKCLVRAAAYPDGGSPTVSRRRTEIQ